MTYHVHISSETERVGLNLGEVWQYRDLIVLLTKKTFTLTKVPAHARLYISALGLYEATINGKPVKDFGAQDQTYADGEVSYSAFYGGDDGEICFHTENPGAGSLLVIGESFDNALLKLLASEYENLYSIDLRNYETDIGHPFDLASYAAEHDIDSVLLIGNLDYWKLEEFLPGGGAA